MNHILLSILIFLVSTSVGFEKKEFKTTHGKTLPYCILYPENYNPNQKYPLVLFLHGAGERGSDNELQLKNGAKLFLDSSNRSKYPAIVIFPQCPIDSYWSSVKINRTTNPLTIDFTYNSELNWPAQAAVDLVKSMIKEGKVDKNRVYIAGLSMGGMGTMEIVSRNPNLFAAAVAICGGADLDYVNRYAKKIPVRLFHGASDDVVSVEHSRYLVRAIQKAGGNVTYTEYPNVKHDSWQNAFNEPDFLEWIFSKKKK